MNVATVEWGKGGRRHLYAHGSGRTVCGKPVPGWKRTKGGVTFEAVEYDRAIASVSCDSCLSVDDPAQAAEVDG